MLQLTTDRLILRSVQPTDAEALFAYRKDKEVSQYLSWIPEKPEDLVNFIREKVNPKANEAGSWHQLVMIEKDSGHIIGDIGLHFLEDEKTATEIGYTLSKAAQGKGYAREATAATIDYLLQQLKKQKIIAFVDPANAPSIRLLERLGFRQVAHHKNHVQIRGVWYDDLEYQLNQIEKND